MSSSLKVHDIVKSAALSILFATFLCLCLPARAAEDANQVLSDIGLGIIEWVVILFVIIMVCAFHDGKSRDADRDESRDETHKRPD